MSGSILGTWVGKHISDARSTLVITFLNNGTYLLGDEGDASRDATGQNGIEIGTYSYNANSGTLSFNTQTNTDGQWGASNAPAITSQVTGDTLIFDTGDGAALFSRVGPFPDSIVGSWYYASPDGLTQELLAFTSSGSMELIISSPTVTGMALGSYTFNASTGAFSASYSVNTAGNSIGRTGTSGTMSINGVSLSVSLSNGIANTFSAVDENFRATGAVETLVGTTGRDYIAGVGGNSTVDAYAGTDTFITSKNLSNYTLAKNSTGWTVTATNGNTISLSNVERIQFTDVSKSLDMATNQAGGMTALLIGATLGRSLAFANDSTKQLVLGNVLNLFDSGYSLSVLSGALMRLNHDNLDIWTVLAGGNDLSHIASYVLRTVNGQAPSQTALNAALSQLNQEIGTGGEGGWLAAQALSQANQLQVDLVGLQQTGMTFLSS